MNLADASLIPSTDIRAALDATIEQLAQTSRQHAEEIGRYIHEAFRPNEQLVPMGVLLMFHLGSAELAQKMAQVAYPPVMTTLTCRMVESELRKLPGVDAAFAEFEAATA